MTRIKNIPVYLKAITAAVVAALGSLSVALGQGPLNLQAVVTIIITAVTALGAVWAVPNKGATP